MKYREVIDSQLVWLKERYCPSSTFALEGVRYPDTHFLCNFCYTIYPRSLAKFYNSEKDIKQCDACCQTMKEYINLMMENYRKQKVRYFFRSIYMTWIRKDRHQRFTDAGGRL